MFDASSKAKSLGELGLVVTLRSYHKDYVSVIVSFKV